MVLRKQGGDRVKVLVLTNMYPTPSYASHGTFVEQQVKFLKKEGVEVDVLFVNGIKSKLNYLWGIPRLWARLLTNRYDLIHAHYVFSGIIARAQFLYPVVLTHHGSQVFRGREVRFCKMVTPLMDRAIVVSPEMKEKGRLSKAHVIPCGIDLDLFKPIPKEQAREELNLPQDKKLVLYAGEYFRWIKRFDIVQESIKLLQEKNPDVELVLVSKQPLSVVPKYMSACDVLVLVSDAEGSPMVIKEAMACNLPVVSVPVGDVPAVIGDTEGCYLCSQDPQDVAEKLELALQRQGRTNGREKIGHMEAGAIARRIISLYHDLIREKRRQRLAKLRFWQNGSKV
jgi:glycosyltransferase involved in cell wall biosynthesis